MSVKTSPHPEDIFAGKTLRKLRICTGMSQEELGKEVGVTFQQVQKYERGENQISLRKIKQFAALFKVSPLEFFQAGQQNLDIEDIKGESIKLIRFFSKIAHKRDKEIVLNLAGSLAKNNGEKN